MKKMIHRMISNLMLLSVLSFVLVSCSQPAEQNSEQVAKAMQPEEPSQEELIATGAHLVKTMGCHDCHSPKMMTPDGPVPDPDRLLSGHPADEALAEYDPAMVEPGKFILMNQSITGFAGPWGTSYAANLTSDATGIGNWTEESFKIALTEGWFKGVRDSRKLLPPMPWPNLTELTDEEIHAIFTYLKSTKPIQNIVPPPAPPGGAVES
jgi:mono/diheme cytochrome c family protein